jgi:hypothetical protein
LTAVQLPVFAGSQADVPVTLTAVGDIPAEDTSWSMVTTLNVSLAANGNTVYDLGQVRQDLALYLHILNTPSNSWSITAGASLDGVNWVSLITNEGYVVSLNTPARYIQLAGTVTPGGTGNLQASLAVVARGFWADPVTSLDGVDATSPVTGVVVDYGQVMNDHAGQFNVDVQGNQFGTRFGIDGSLDGTNWYGIYFWGNASYNYQEISFYATALNQPARYVRAKAGGVNPGPMTVTVLLTAGE